jgi:hypothetical protein
MIMVLAMGTVLTLLVSTALALSLSGMVKAKTDQNWAGAIAAAYAGVEEYSSRVANDNTYQQYGNKSALFSSASPSLVLPSGTKVNPAFGLGASGTWANVPGSDGASSWNLAASFDGTSRCRDAKHCRQSEANRFHRLPVFH